MGAKQTTSYRDSKVNQSIFSRRWDLNLLLIMMEYLYTNSFNNKLQRTILTRKYRGKTRVNFKNYVWKSCLIWVKQHPANYLLCCQY